MTRRGLALVRVSKVGDRGDDLISPDLQRAAITTYASQRDIDITDWIEALDESGSQKRSRWWATLDGAVTRLEQERLDVLLVWKFSRFSRDRLKWAVTLDRVEQAGSTLESATEGIDTTTSTGRFTRGMLAELEAFRAEQIGDVWREVKARRVRLGLGDGAPRFGYVVKDGLYLPDPKTKQHLRRMYQQAAAGVPYRTIAAGLNQAGVVTLRGNAWTGATVRQVISNGFAAGLLRTRDGFSPGQHKPLIDEVTWQRCLHRLQPTDGQLIRSSDRHTWSGLLLCNRCGRKLHASSKAGWPAGSKWVCGGLSRFQCEGTSAWAPSVERVVDDWIAGLLVGRDEQFREAVQRRPREEEKIRRRLLTIEDDLLTIARKNQQGFYDDLTYLRLRAELLDEQRLLTKQQDREPIAVPRSAMETLRALPDGPVKNEALRRVLKHVRVYVNVRPKYVPIGLWVVEA